MVYPLASNWGTIDTTIDITLYITGFVFVAVNLFLAYAIYRFRHDPSRRAHYEPENKKLETWLTAITAVGVAAMLAPGLIVWADFVDVPEDADEIEVVGHSGNGTFACRAQTVSWEKWMRATSAQTTPLA